MWILQIDVILLHSQESLSQLCEDKDKMRRDNYELRESLERHLHLIEQKDRTIKALQVLLLIVDYLCIPTTCTCTPVYCVVVNTGQM